MFMCTKISTMLIPIIATSCNLTVPSLGLMMVPSTPSSNLWPHRKWAGHFTACPPALNPAGSIFSLRGPCLPIFCTLGSRTWLQNSGS